MAPKPHKPHARRIHNTYRGHDAEPNEVHDADGAADGRAEAAGQYVVDAAGALRRHLAVGRERRDAGRRQRDDERRGPRDGERKQDARVPDNVPKLDVDQHAPHRLAGRQVDSKECALLVLTRRVLVVRVKLQADVCILADFGVLVRRKKRLANQHLGSACRGLQSRVRLSRSALAQVLAIPEGLQRQMLGRS
jgi:hypothetical protein